MSSRGINRGPSGRATTDVRESRRAWTTAVATRSATGMRGVSARTTTTTDRRDASWARDRLGARTTANRPRIGGSSSRMGATTTRTTYVETSEGCADALVAVVKNASARAIASRGTFSIALAGGSLIRMLGALKKADAEVEFGKWVVFWVDERCVKWADAESNFGGAKRALFDDVDVPKSSLFAIDETLCETNAGAAIPCAEAYEKDLRALTPHAIELDANGLPVFDMLLLGFGPDGHICSLFPNHELLKATDGWILPITDSPKPPPERVTFSLPVVNAAREKVFVASGEGKAEMTARILEEAPQDGSIPAALVTGNVRWIIDAAAASKMRNK